MRFPFASYVNLNSEAKHTGILIIRIDNAKHKLCAFMI